MIDKLLDIAFGCRHRQLTRPITPVHKGDTPPNSTYVACLECGKRFHYDAENMRLGALVLPEPAYKTGAFQSQM